MRLVILTVLAGLLAAPASPHKRPIVPTLADLATVWVGESPGIGLEYFRLELDSNGKGLLTVQWLPNQDALAYRIVSTRLSEYQVAFGLESIDRPDESIYLRGEALLSFLDLEVGSQKPKWKRRLTMQPHAKLMSRLKAVADRAVTYQEAGK